MPDFQDLIDEYQRIYNTNIALLSEPNGTDQNCKSRSNNRHLLFHPVSIIFELSYSVVLLLLSLIGNLVSFIIFKKEALQKTSKLYLSTLAISDLLVAVFKFSAESLSYNAQIMYIYARVKPPLFFDIFTGQNACNILSFLQFVSKVESALILCLFSVERMVIIYYPFRKNIASVRWSVARLFSTLVPSVWCGFSYFQTFESNDVIVKTNSENFNVSVCVLSPNAVEISSGPDFILRNLLPLSVLSCTNILIFKKLRTNSKGRGRFSEILKRSQTNSEIIVTKRIFFIGVYYLLTSLCLFVVHLISVMVGSKCLLRLTMPPFLTISAAFKCFQETNFVINFYFYWITEESFRLKAKALLTCNFAEYSSLSYNKNNHFSILAASRVVLPTSRYMSWYRKNHNK